MMIVPFAPGATYGNVESSGLRTFSRIDRGS